MSDSLYWFDYETFGTSPAWDRPVQFAGRRTDLNLEPIGKPIEIYCQQSVDYLPNPIAALVTGITPQLANEKGVPEYQFIEKILSEIGADGTCSVGYNNVRFDDEFTRFTAFRNFYDAYEHEWKSNNSRWDLLDVVRLTRALRPDGIEWPIDENGKAVNKLELITTANGLTHSQAHDAMSDVDATIDVARLIKRTQPKLYDYAFNHRDKHSLAQILNVATRNPCVQISGMIPSEHGHAAIVIPVARHPVNPNGVIVLDCRSDPAALTQLSEDEIVQRVFTRDATLKAERLNLRVIHINKCPVVVPLSTMREQDAERLGIDLPKQLQRVKQFEALYNNELSEKVRRAMTRTFDYTCNDVDGSLYGGKFFSRDDKQRFEHIRAAAGEGLSKHIGHFDDPRLDEMLFRYKARNYPQLLSNEESIRWNEFCGSRLNNIDAQWLDLDSFDQLMKETDWSNNTPLQKALNEYAGQLRARFS
ncbi:MAG: exodeoxyribonuclease I [Granulosicoccaceae bacterium]